jgi:hypothetical protein
LKPLLEEIFLHLATMYITEINPSQVVGVLKKQVPAIHIGGELFSSSIFVILVLITSPSPADLTSWFDKSIPPANLRPRSFTRI